mgnify:CR=1 FL=1
MNHYTAYKRLRSDDAYTAGNVAGFRPDYASVVYTKIVKQLFPNIPVILGGVEASMRRISHYDYWSDTLKPSVLVDAGADYLVYGMGERPIVAIAEAFQNKNWNEEIRKIPQVAYFTKDKSVIFEHSTYRHQSTRQTLSSPLLQLRKLQYSEQAQHRPSLVSLRGFLYPTILA